MDYIEPMTLGSPVGSPGHSASLLHQSSLGNQFLPGYLMGDVSVNATPSGLPRTFGNKSHFSTPISGMQSKSPPMQKVTPQQSKPAPFFNPSLVSKEKVGTPPVHTLMEDLNQSEAAHTQAYTDLPMRTLYDPYVSQNASAPASPSKRQQLFKQHMGKTPPSPGQSDPFYTQGELLTPSTQLDDTWVTVFGFSPSSASFVVQRFSQYGTILAHRTAPSGGNWMHIHFATSLQARKALSRNGKVLPGNIMIGVVPCVDVKLMSKQRDETLSKSIYLSPAPAAPSSVSGTPVQPRKHATIRPLTAAYNAAASDQAVASDVQTPQKTNGFLTKAMDYIFG